MKTRNNNRGKQRNIDRRMVLILVATQKKRTSRTTLIKNRNVSPTQKVSSKVRPSEAALVRVPKCNQAQTKITAPAQAHLQRKIFEGSTINFGEHIGTCLELDLSDWKPIF